MLSDSDDDDIAALLEAPVHSRKKTKARKSTGKKKDDQRELRDKRISEAPDEKNTSNKRVTFSDDANPSSSSQKSAGKFEGDVWKPKPQRNKSSLDFNMDDIMGISSQTSEVVKKIPSGNVSSKKEGDAGVRLRTDNLSTAGGEKQMNASKSRTQGSDSNRVGRTRTATEQPLRRESRTISNDPMQPRKNAVNSMPSSYIVDTSHLVENTYRQSRSEGKAARSADLVSAKEEEIVAVQRTIATLKEDIITAQSKLLDEQVKRKDTEAKLQGASLNASEERNLIEASHKRQLDELRIRHERQLKETTESHERAASNLKISNESQHEHSKELLATVSKQIESSIETFKSLEAECGTIKSTIDNCNKAQMGASESSVHQWKSLIELESTKLQNATQQLAQVFQRNEDDHRRHFNAEASRLDKLQRSFEDRIEKFDKEKRVQEESFASRLKEIQSEKVVLNQDRSRMEAMRDECTKAQSSFDESKKAEEAKLYKYKEELKNEAHAIQQQREAAKMCIESARVARIEMEDMTEKIKCDSRKLNALRNEITQLGAMVCERGAKADELFASAERIERETSSGKREVQLMRDSIEAEKAKLSQAAKQSDRDRLHLAEQRVELLRQQATAGKLNINQPNRSHFARASNESASDGFMEMEDSKNFTLSSRPPYVVGGHMQECKPFNQCRYSHEAQSQCHARVVSPQAPIAAKKSGLTTDDIISSVRAQVKSLTEPDFYGSMQHGTILCSF